MPPLVEQKELRPSGFGVSVGSASSSVTSDFVPSDLLSVLVDRLRRMTVHRGVFISVDEAQKLSETDAEAICTAVQMALRKGLPAMLVLAGLPGAKEHIASFGGCTFMWRTLDVRLGSLRVDETHDAFRKMFALVPDVNVDDGALEAIVQLSKGHPYLIQLAGYHTVEYARERYNDVERAICENDVQLIEPMVLDAYVKDVLKPAFSPLRGGTIEYLRSMCRCLDADGRVSTANVAQELGKNASQLSVYRERLINRRLIVPDGHGFVRFGLPYCPQYFQDEDASQQAPVEWRY